MHLLVKHPRTRQRLSSSSHKLGLQRNLQPSPGKSLSRKRKAFSISRTEQIDDKDYRFSLSSDSLLSFRR
jgi:hypothetical protein